MSARRPPVTPDGLAFRCVKIALDTTYRPQLPGVHDTPAIPRYYTNNVWNNEEITFEH